MASGDLCAYVIQEISPNWLWVAFTSGSVAPVVGDTIWGDTSDAQAILELIVVTGGTWGGGDAAGWMFLSNWNNTAWSSGENWTKNSGTPANDGTLTTTPVSCGASPDLVNDVPVSDFDDTVNEAKLFLCKRLTNSAAGGIDVRIETLGAAAANDYSMGGAFRSFTDDVDNFLSTSFNAWGTVVYNTAIDAPSVIGEPTYDTIAFSDGAEVDNLAASELFLFLLFRDAQDATNDDMAGDVSLVNIEFVLT